MATLLESTTTVVQARSAAGTRALWRRCLGDKYMFEKEHVMAPKTYFGLLPSWVSVLRASLPPIARRPARSFRTRLDVEADVDEAQIAKKAKKATKPSKAQLALADLPYRGRARSPCPSRASPRPRARDPSGRRCTAGSRRKS